MNLVFVLVLPLTVLLLRGMKCPRYRDLSKSYLSRNSLSTMKSLFLPTTSLILSVLLLGVVLRLVQLGGSPEGTGP